MPNAARGQDQQLQAPAKQGEANDPWEIMGDRRPIRFISKNIMGLLIFFTE
jgi:hypothetical protein